MNTKSKEGLLKRLHRRTYRRAFVAANVGVQIAAQLYALRTSRKLSQEKLAEDIGMNQARISLMEKPEYQNYNIKTLKRFGDFYDVALDVRFVSIKDHVNRIINQSPEDMAPPPFGDESVASPSKPDVEPIMSDFKETSRGQVERGRPNLSPAVPRRDIKPTNVVRPVPKGGSKEKTLQAQSMPVPQ